MKFKNNIEVQAGLKDSSGSIGSSSQVLSSNGTNVAWVSLSSYVSGTGTTNYVSKFTGATSVGNSQIFDNGTNVGINTATPGAKLEVNGTIKTTNDNLSFTGTSLYAGNSDGTVFGYTPADGISSITDLPIIQSGWVSSFKYNGQTLERCTAGEAITKGQLIYLRSNGSWNIANARFTASSTPLLGIALDTVSAAGTLAVLLDGIIITAEHTQAGSSTPGSPLYVESSTAGTAGDVTETAPTSGGEVVRLIGHNISDITGGVIIRFQPDNTWVEL